MKTKNQLAPIRLPPPQAKQASVLIVTLWVLSLLTVFAVSLGFTARAQLHYARHFRDRQRAYYLARAGIEKAIAALEGDEIEGYDALNQDWANNEGFFKEFSIGDGFVTVSYFLDEGGSGEGREDRVILYGAMDESGKIDINHVSAEILTNLLERVGGVSVNQARDIAWAIVDWRDEDSIVSPGGAENEYYENLAMPYRCKNGKLQAIQELLLVRGMTREILSRIDETITVYGTEKVNINTAGFHALHALGLSKNLCERIINHRRGRDSMIGTEDDNIFKAVGGLRNIGPLFTEESAQINRLISSNMLTVKSDVFRINASGQIRSERGTHSSNIVCVVKRQQDKQPEILYWYEQ
jgi:general secretion pathway protein K